MQRLPLKFYIAGEYIKSPELNGLDIRSLQLLRRVP
jgi:hypothetical protein